MATVTLNAKKITQWMEDHQYVFTDKDADMLYGLPDEQVAVLAEQISQLLHNEDLYGGHYFVANVAVQSINWVMDDHWRRASTSELMDMPAAPLEIETAWGELSGRALGMILQQFIFAHLNPYGNLSTEGKRKAIEAAEVLDEADAENLRDFISRIRFEVNNS